MSLDDPVITYCQNCGAKAVVPRGVLKNCTGCKTQFFFDKEPSGENLYEST